MGKPYHSPGDELFLPPRPWLNYFYHPAPVPPPWVIYLWVPATAPSKWWASAHAALGLGLGSLFTPKMYTSWPQNLYICWSILVILLFSANEHILKCALLLYSHTAFQLEILHVQVTLILASSILFWNASPSRYWSLMSISKIIIFSLISAPFDTLIAANFLLFAKATSLH